MNEVSNVPRVYAAVHGVMADLSELGISKARRNKDQGYSFRGIDDVLNALSGLLVKHRLLMIPIVEDRTITTRESAKGGYIGEALVTVTYRLISVDDGSSIDVKTYGQGMDSADKQVNKAMSGSYKYAAFLAFCIPLEGVLDEGDYDTPTPAPAHPAPAPAHPASPPASSAPAPAGKRAKRSDAASEPVPALEPESAPNVAAIIAQYDNPAEALPWRVENVWPLVLDAVRRQTSDDDLKENFAVAYRWARALPAEAIAANLMQQIKAAYDARKAAAR